jgi:biopolymer transport protein ExbD
MEKQVRHILMEIIFMADFIAAKKTTPRVDLTPMVDLGFLLITFFIVSTTMQQQRGLKFFLPADGPPSLAPESSSLTLVPTENNTVLYYMGTLETAAQLNQLGTTGFSLTEGVGQLIRNKKSALRSLGKDKDFTVLIYPDGSSSYKNMVDIIDELLINDVRKYCLSENTVAIDNLKLALKNK